MIHAVTHSLQRCQRTQGCDMEQQYQSLKWGKERKANTTVPRVILPLCICKNFKGPSIIPLIFTCPSFFPSPICSSFPVWSHHRTYLKFRIQPTLWRMVGGKEDNQHASSHLLHLPTSTFVCPSHQITSQWTWHAARSSLNTSPNAAPIISKPRFCLLAHLSNSFLGFQEFLKIQMPYLFYLPSSFLLLFFAYAVNWAYCRAVHLLGA